jgi:hypothetical protein
VVPYPVVRRAGTARRVSPPAHRRPDGKVLETTLCPMIPFASTVRGRACQRQFALQKPTPDRHLHWVILEFVFTMRPTLPGGCHFN